MVELCAPGVLQTWANWVCTLHRRCMLMLQQDQLLLLLHACQRKNINTSADLLLALLAACYGCRDCCPISPLLEVAMTVFLATQ